MVSRSIEEVTSYSTCNKIKIISYNFCDIFSQIWSKGECECEFNCRVVQYLRRNSIVFCPRFNSINSILHILDLVYLSNFKKMSVFSTGKCHSLMYAMWKKWCQKMQWKLRFFLWCNGKNKKNSNIDRMSLLQSCVCVCQYAI